ncbi:TPA: hypothetical protein ACX6SZ_003757 [Photobacterium damselae]
MNNTMIKLICLVLSVATACLSATLTTKFMFSIGEDIGSPRLMASLGLLLDLAKCATPLFVLFLWSQKMRLASVFALVLSITLSVVSFSASVAALESGVKVNKQNSVSYQRIETQIKDYRVQVAELRQLAQRQQDAKQITKSQITLSHISPLLSHVDQLSAQQSQLSSGESVVSQYGMIISYVTAAALELLSWLFVCVSNALCQQRAQTQSRTVKRNKPELETIAINITDNDVDSAQQSNALTQQLNAINDESTKSQAQLYFDIKNAVLTKSVKPNQRGILSKFSGVGRELMNDVLRDLCEVGFLKPFRNGYTYA